MAEREAISRNKRKIGIKGEGREREVMHSLLLKY